MPVRLKSANLLEKVCVGIGQYVWQFWWGRGSGGCCVHVERQRPDGGWSGGSFYQSEEYWSDLSDPGWCGYWGSEAGPPPERDGVVDREVELMHLRIRALELEWSARPTPTTIGMSLSSTPEQFDVRRHNALVPQFREREENSYFSAFENIVATLKWPKDVWSLLL